MMRLQPLRKIHWRAPTIIALAFLSALAFAIGHHAFYAHLDNRPVDEGNLFTQQTNLAIGTAFAFLFRASLVIAIGAAYWQVFWATLLRRDKPLALDQVAALGGILGSLFDFANVRALLRSPELAALALLVWLVPLAALLPPATLSIENVQHFDYTQLEVPVLNFSSDSFLEEEDIRLATDADGRDFRGSDGRFVSRSVIPGSSDRLKYFARSTATQYRIPDFPAIGTNMTYALSFEGSTLQCVDVVDTNLQYLRTFLNTDCDLYRMASCGMSGTPAVVYYSWVPTSPDGRSTQNLTLDFEDGTNNPAYGSPYLFIATRPVAVDLYTLAYQDWNILNCSLNYATYAATVSSSNDRSAISNYTVQSHDQVIPQGTTELELLRHAPASMPSRRDYGHLAVMDSLADVLTSWVGGPYVDTDQRMFSGVYRSTLMFTSDLLLYPLTYMVSRWGWDNRTDDDIINDKASYPIGALAASTYNGSLASAVEELYHNITLSLFSREEFWADSGNLTDITIERWLNKYSYRMRNLLLSYSIALLFSLLACALGLHTVYRIGGSYSNKFSTILRTTRGHLESFEALLTEKDRSGMDPLPKCLAKAELSLGRGGSMKERESHCESEMELQQRLVPAGGQSAVTECGEGDGQRQGGVDHLGLTVHEVSSEFSHESFEELQRVSVTSD